VTKIPAVWAYIPDTLFIEMRDEPSGWTDEVSADVTLDYNEGNQIVGLTVEHASTAIDLGTVEVSEFRDVRDVGARAIEPTRKPVGA